MLDNKKKGVTKAKQSITSFDRPNISLEVRPSDKRVEQIIQFIGKRSIT